MPGYLFTNLFKNEFAMCAIYICQDKGDIVIDNGWESGQEIPV